MSRKWETGLSQMREKEEVGNKGFGVIHNGDSLLRRVVKIVDRRGHKMRKGGCR